MSDRYDENEDDDKEEEEEQEQQVDSSLPTLEELTRVGEFLKEQAPDEYETLARKLQSKAGPPDYSKMKPDDLIDAYNDGDVAFSDLPDAVKRRVE